MVSIKKIIGFLFLSFILVNCDWDNKDSIILEPKVFSNHINKQNIQLVDVRTPKEHSREYIQGAININYYSENFADSLLLLNREKAVYVFCRSGKRSNKSVTKFKKIGFDTIYQLKGGFLNWKKEGFKIVTK